ncbi:hypothetical protein JDV02_000250 [Purpureocillium takamizusanense]|uniref:Protein kinase domain-containing protein n=1 Tax=Purpureocillium takamizusanense TaxID=2060973 RepID=A0A9Q8Q5R6_9HYPO|nr:uncharacterized protein JDV02_000250 [Purpureocillium takamizusanense]UNI13510.1 hypothetical protein JDV02_000250 [Purpureocillium takamizusanense]
MASPDGTESEPPPVKRLSFLRKFMHKSSQRSSSVPKSPPQSHVPDPREAVPEDPVRPTVPVHVAGREVITGLPRSQTFARQQSEQRMNLAPVAPSADERRAASVDRRSRSRHHRRPSELGANPRVSAPGLLGSSQGDNLLHHSSLYTGDFFGDGLAVQSLDADSSTEPYKGGDGTVPTTDGSLDAQSMTTSQHEAMINDELERKWILNLSMHFRDRSKREKFFVTYREKEHIWRRVTISLDYRYATLNSLEMDLFQTRYQREKSAKIYEAIRESLADIKFYDTVTNLKLETTDGRLHVHVVEDGNEIINYPSVSQVRHLGCRRIRERDIVFDSHMSGFVYKVNVHGHVLIKKEIPSQDTIDEFLYEVNALNSLRYSNDVVHFYGVVVDDEDEFVKGLLISYASQGALIDIIYDHCKDSNYTLSWATKERWARQIVRGLSDVHESGFVQGDFTLSNIVIDEFDNAKIIDINRRGCPVGWEPPEATALINAGHRISMYIGVKSDLYQLGMVLWGLAMEEDEPEAHGRPLMLGPEINVPDWYRQMTEICLSADPRMRQQASTLLRMFPSVADEDEHAYAKQHPVTADDGQPLNELFVDAYQADARPLIRTVEPPNDLFYSGRTYVDTSPVPYEQYYPARGRSPPSPLPSDFDICESSRDPFSKTSWAANRSVRPSYTDVGADDMATDDMSQAENEHSTPTPTTGIAAVGDAPLAQPSDPGAGSVTTAPAVAGGLTNHGAEAAGVASPNDISDAVREQPGVTGAEGAPIPSLVRTDTVIKLDTVSAVRAKEPADAGAASALKTPKIEKESAAPEAVHCPRAQTPEGCMRPAIAPQTHENAAGYNSDRDIAVERVPVACPEGLVESRQETTTLAPNENAETGTERQTEHLVAQQLSSTMPTSQAERDDETGQGAYSQSSLSNSTAGAASRSRMASLPLDDSGTPSMSHAARGGQPKPGFVRQASLPESLTGIGAAHLGIDDSVMQRRGIFEDDLNPTSRPSTVPAVMITTDLGT